MIATALSLAFVFFYIGLFGFGGGYAMISLIQFEVVNNHQWMNNAEFANLLALSQMTPGPISINSATYVGFNVMSHYGNPWGIAGSVISTLSLCLPSVLLMWVVIRFLFRNEDNRYVNYVFSGLRPAVVGLIFSAGLMMMINCDPIHDFATGAASSLQLAWKEENFGDTALQHAISAVICVVTFVAIYFFKKNPIYLILLSGLAGLLIYYVAGPEVIPRIYI